MLQKRIQKRKIFSLLQKGIPKYKVFSRMLQKRIPKHKIFFRILQNEITKHKLFSRKGPQDSEYSLKSSKKTPPNTKSSSESPFWPLFNKSNNPLSYEKIKYNSWNCCRYSKGSLKDYGICVKTQTENLSKKLDRRIFGLKILHHQFHLISTVLVSKNTKK